MTLEEHYREAERLIEPGAYDEDGEQHLLARDIAVAQIHATLALYRPPGEHREDTP